MIRVLFVNSGIWCCMIIVKEDSIASEYKLDDDEIPVRAFDNDLLQTHSAKKKKKNIVTFSAFKDSILQSNR